MKENKVLYKFLKVIYSGLLKILYRPQAYGVNNIPVDGAVRIAKQANSKIVPFAIRGGYKIFRKGLVIEFGKTVDVSNMEVEEANNYIRNEVLKLLRK